MRFSLLSLIGFVALAAVGCAALVNANDPWLVGVSTFMFIVVTAGITVAILGHGSTKAFAIGFAVWSLAYLLLAFFMDQNLAADHLATTQLMESLWRSVTNEVVNEVVLANGAAGRVVTGGPDHDTFMQIGQQLWALLIGCLGGVFASWLWRRRAI